MTQDSGAFVPHFRLTILQNTVIIHRTKIRIKVVNESMYSRATRRAQL
jgi:hypothetical protein